MSNDIHSPHDKFFKDTFSRKQSAIGYLKGYLPKEISGLIDFSSLELYPGEYIDNVLKGSSSDLVFKVEINKADAYLYLLFEHQSSPEPMMAYRLLKYMVRLWESILKDNSALNTLPPILPLVLYQGKVPWKASPQFIDLMDDPPVSFLPFLPSFSYLLVDLVHDSADKVVDDVYGQISLHLMKAVANGTLLETVVRDGDLIRRLLSQDNALELLETVFRYMLQADDSIDIEGLQQLVVQAVSTDKGDKVMGTIAEKIEEKGVQRGLLQGLEKGMQKGLKEGVKEVAVRMLEEQAAPTFIAKVTGLPLAEIEELQVSL